MKHLRHVDVALTVLATAWLAWSVARFPAWTVDDAFIVARYADNAIAHGELAFNAGAGAADRVEGFTSVLAMLVALLARAVNADPIAATKVLCVAAALSGPALLTAFARRARATRLAGGCAAVLFAVLPEHAMHARSGLETELFVACTLALLVAFTGLLSRNATPKAFIALSIVELLARPEGASVVAILALVVAVSRRAAERRLLVRRLAAGIALPFAVLTIARLAYYGAIVPNTFHAKRGPWNAAHATDLRAFFDVVVVDLVVVAFASFALSRIAKRTKVRLPPRLLYACAAAVLALVVQLAGYARAEPIMDYGRRFAWHGIAFVAVILVVALDTIVRAFRPLFRRHEAIAIALVVAAAIAATRRTEPAKETEEAYAARQAASVDGLQLPTIAWVTDNMPRDALLAVYPDAGRLPFVTGRRTIDFGKLNDRVLARAETNADVVRYFFERKPDVIVFGRKASGRLFDAGAEAIVADARFAAEYTLAQRVGANAESDAYDIYRRVR